EQVEEELRRKGRQGDAVFLQRLQHLILLGGCQLVERLAVSAPAVSVDLPDADAIDLLRRQTGLEPLLGRAFDPGSSTVIATVGTPRAGQLAVNVDRDAGIFRARRELVGGYQALDHRVEKGDL